MRDLNQQLDMPLSGPFRKGEFEMGCRNGIVTIRSATLNRGRRVLYINDFGMIEGYEKWCQGLYPSDRFFGCIELARAGYEVLIPERPAILTRYLKNVTTDFGKTLWAALSLGRDDFVYCAHNLLFWCPLLRGINVMRPRVVSFLFAGERLWFSELHDGLLGLTPAAYECSGRLAPRIKRSHIGWGIDLSFFQPFPYEPQFVLYAGKALRDLEVVAKAWAKLDIPLVMLRPFDAPPPPPMPLSVKIIKVGGPYPSVSYRELCDYYYRYAAFSLITLEHDPNERSAVGFTNLLESMATARPVVMTRTGSLRRELDIEAEGIGFYVEPGDPESLEGAVRFLWENRNEAQQMGNKGRQLCKSHYNTERFARNLIEFFEGL